MKIDRTASELVELADAWFDEIRSDDMPNDVDESVGAIVTDMSFFASAEIQWQFLKISVNLAENDEEFGYVAAFSFEQLMSEYGELYIDEVERLSSENERFLSVVQHSYRHLMSGKVWKRIQAVQGVPTKPFWKFW